MFTPGSRACAYRTASGRAKDVDEEFKPVERGWRLGDEQFRQELLEKVSAQRGASHYGEIVQEAAAVQAERFVKTSLKQIKWKEKELVVRRKGDAQKVRLAYELRAKTTVPLAWIAERLKMGSRGYLTWLLYREGTSRK